MFKISSKYMPTGDQPEAIQDLREDQEQTSFPDLFGDDLGDVYADELFLPHGYSGDVGNGPGGRPVPLSPGERRIGDTGAWRNRRISLSYNALSIIAVRIQQRVGPALRHAQP